MSNWENLGDLSGLRTPRSQISFPAILYHQGTRKQFEVVMTVSDLLGTVEPPDPDHPSDENRGITMRHAQDFGKYFRERDDWVSPPLFLRVDPHMIEVTEISSLGENISLVKITIPFGGMRSLQILDGQHRELGFLYAQIDIHEELRNKTALLEQQKEQEQEYSAIQKTQDDIDVLRRQLSKLDREHISVGIVETTKPRGRQIFADISANALGINKDLVTNFNQDNPINRIALDVSDNHPLLKDRVERGLLRRFSRTNPNLMGLNEVAKIAHAILLAPGSRTGSNIANEIEREYAANLRRVNEFLDDLVRGFTDLKRIVDGDFTPIQLRQASLLGSSVMYRCLARAYRNMLLPSRSSAAINRDAIVKLFERLSPHMTGIPIGPQNLIWWPTNAFLNGGSAPIAREGVMSNLAKEIARWGLEGNAILDKSSGRSSG